MCILSILENFKTSEKHWDANLCHDEMLGCLCLCPDCRIALFLINQDLSKSDGPRDSGKPTTTSHTCLVKTFSAMCLKLGSTKLTSRCLKNVYRTQRHLALSTFTFYFCLLSVQPPPLGFYILEKL